MGHRIALDLTKNQRQVVELLATLAPSNWSTNRIAWELDWSHSRTYQCLARLRKRGIVAEFRTGRTCWWHNTAKARKALYGSNT